MATKMGRIVLAQESRFQLIDDGGVAHLFMLSPHAGVEPRALVGLARQQARVAIRFTPEQDVVALLAERVDIEPTAPGNRR